MEHVIRRKGDKFEGRGITSLAEEVMENYSFRKAWW
jgi:hypothetical protein